ncbi:hypothetical protein Rsub_03258 [Raphidocelis subcapitata]|uniref:Uncharacterized protein n=1 Tax=Raphidocelis subcapitata TaxID=307507 RepID=A0A2V0NZ84_9CHLO|nr:hypothetical protein Rsub_03258 [Raphidocelis subcapitata]|eukprot:GBF90125.1 hypothetical protein Rsub_03258 [Raphidocelis subcapitata]
MGPEGLRRVQAAGQQPELGPSSVVRRGLKARRSVAVPSHISFSSPQQQHQKPLLGAGPALAAWLAAHPRALGGVGCWQSPQHADPAPAPAAEADDTCSSNAGDATAFAAPAATPMSTARDAGTGGACDQDCAGEVLSPLLAAPAPAAPAVSLRTASSCPDDRGDDNDDDCRGAGRGDADCEADQQSRPPPAAAADADASPVGRPRKRVRFAEGPVVIALAASSADDAPLEDGGTPAFVGFTSDLSVTSIMALDDLLGPENSHSIARLKRRFGLLQAALCAPAAQLS